MHISKEETEKRGGAKVAGGRCFVRYKLVKNSQSTHRVSSIGVGWVWRGVVGKRGSGEETNKGVSATLPLKNGPHLNGLVRWGNREEGVTLGEMRAW